MKLSKEQLEKITELSSLFLSPREIACLMDLDIPTLLDRIADSSSPEAIAYFKGKTLSKYEIRQKVIALAKMGSPAAETLAERYIEQQRLDEDEQY